jgi:hypothetical protein
MKGEGMKVKVMEGELPRDAQFRHEIDHEIGEAVFPHFHDRH